MIETHESVHAYSKSNRSVTMQAIAGRVRDLAVRELVVRDFAGREWAIRSFVVRDFVGREWAIGSFVVRELAVRELARDSSSW